MPSWRLGDGPQQPGAEIFMRAAYDDTHIYLAFRWADDKRQDRMGQWLFDGGQWRADLAWPDALALHWQATETVDDFKQGGCAVLCHTTGRFTEFPRMATRQQGAVVDEWYWNAFAAAKAGRPGDGFLDDRVEFIPKGSPTPALRWAPPAISAAHGSDASGTRRPQTVGGVSLSLNLEETEGEPPHPRFNIQEVDQLSLQTAGRRPPAGNTLPLYETSLPEDGDSADIDGRASWSDGFWTLELSRVLRTSSKRDVQLDPAEKSFAFGLAVWDGSTGDQHLVVTAVRLRFESPEK